MSRSDQSESHSRRSELRPIIVENRVKRTLTALVTLAVGSIIITELVYFSCSIFLASPFLFMVLFRSYGGEIQFSSRSKLEWYKKGREAGIGFWLLFWSAAVFCSLVMQFSMVSYGAFFKPGLVVGVFVSVLLLLAKPSLNAASKALVVFYSLFYGWIAPIYLNVVGDTAPTRLVKTKVIEKSLVKTSKYGSATQPHVFLSLLAPAEGSLDLDVRREWYDKVRVGEVHPIGIHGGLFGVPWKFSRTWKEKYTSDDTGPTEPDGLDHETVSRTVSSYKLHFRNCYQSALDHKKDTDGKITYRWQVNPSGAVQAVQVESNSVGSQTLEDCFQKVILEMKFPRAANQLPTTVVYPFSFQSKP